MPEKGAEQSTYEQHVINQVYRTIGSKKVTRKKMERAAQWLLDKSVKSELE